jgi:DNA-binding transcriptional LysR family regulator
MFFIYWIILAHSVCNGAMDLAALNAFAEVARNGSFSLAAHALHLTQPAVSRRIAGLEAELGARLFDRIGRQVTLTEAGTALLPRARALLNDAEDLRRLVSSLSGRVEGPLVMATSHHVGLRRLPPVLRRFTRRHPLVALEIRFMDSEAACQGVEAGELELAVVTLPLEPIAALETVPVWRDPLRFVVALGDPLAGAPSVTIEELARRPAVLPSSATYTRAILERAMRERGLVLDVRMSTNYLETLRMLVVTGFGWSLLPETMVDCEIRALPVAWPVLERSLGVVVHRSRALSNAARAMIECCRSAATAGASG